MSVYGLDYAFSKPSPASIKAAGYVFVSRYLSWLPNAKVLTAAERDGLLAEGIDIYLNWEYDEHDCLRGAAGGTTDATEAVKQALALGYPAGTTIYHSADFDVTDAQKPVVAAYTNAARAVEAPAGYRTGCYSGFYTIKYLFDHAAIDDGWQAFAWSAGQWDPRAALRQVENGVNVGGADCDVDEKVGIGYSWLHPGGGAMSQPTAQQVDDIAWVVDAMLNMRPAVAGGRYKGSPTPQVSAIQGLQTDVAAIKEQLAALQPGTGGGSGPTAAEIAKAVNDDAAARLQA